MAQLAGWHDHLMMVGGGAAALTGLLFVAMTPHSRTSPNPSTAIWARTILTGLPAAFIRCALVPVGGRDGRAIAIELIVLGIYDPWSLLGTVFS